MAKLGLSLPSVRGFWPGIGRARIQIERWSFGDQSLFSFAAGLDRGSNTGGPRARRSGPRQIPSIMTFFTRRMRVMSCDGSPSNRTKCGAKLFHGSPVDTFRGGLEEKLKEIPSQP